MGGGSFVVVAPARFAAGDRVRVAVGAYCGLVGVVIAAECGSEWRYALTLNGLTPLHADCVSAWQYELAQVREKGDADE